MAEMKKIAFKGFRQVTNTTFEAQKGNNALSGYIWFVRTPSGAEGFDDDIYDIYFGTKHYAHFDKTDKEGLASLSVAMEKIKTSLGLDEKYEQQFAEIVTDVTKVPTNGNLNDVITALCTELNTLSSNYTTLSDTVATKAVDIEKYVGDDQKHYISLKNAAGIKIGTPLDVEEFIADGILKSAVLVTVSGNQETVEGTSESAKPVETEGNKLADGTYIKLSFNGKGSGNKKPIYLDTKSLIKVYKSTDGSLKITGDDIAVEKVVLNKSFASEKIPVAGGPLAKVEGVSDLFKDGIPTDMTMQDVLMTLFCKEEWPAPKVDDGSILATVTSDGITNKLTPSGTVEVGTEISYTVSGQATKESHSVRNAYGFTNGYATDVQGNGASTATSKSANVVSGPTVSGYGDLSVSGAATNSCVKSAENPNGTTLTGTFKVAEAKTYTLTATENPNVYSIEYGTLPVLYGKSNIGKYKEDCKSTERAENITKTSTKSAKTKNASVTGDYRYFEGWATSVPTNKSELIALNHLTGWLGNGFTLKVDKEGENLGIVPAQNFHCIAVPSGCKLTSVLNGMNLESKGSYFESGDVDYALANGTVVKYHIFYQEIKSDLKYNMIVVTK